MSVTLVPEDLATKKINAYKNNYTKITKYLKKQKIFEALQDREDKIIKCANINKNSENLKIRHY